MKQAYIKEEEIPPGWKNESVDFINKVFLFQIINSYCKENKK